MGWAERNPAPLMVRLALLGGNLFILVLAVSHHYWATALVLAIPLAIQSHLLMQFLQRQQERFHWFLTSIRHADFTTVPRVNSRPAGADPLADAYHEALDSFRRQQTDLETRLLFHRNVLQHLDAGVLMVDSEDRIQVGNPTLRKMLGPGRWRSLDDLSARYPNLVRVIREIRPGDRRKVDLESGLEPRRLLVTATGFRFQGSRYRVITLQDLRRELDDVEIDAWQSLIRVLTHEIMNSMTPIISLTSTALAKLKESEPAPGGETLEDVIRALTAVRKRSEGLLRFVEDYRKLTHLPPPRPEWVSISELFRRIERLLAPEHRLHRIDFKTLVDPEDLRIHVDPELFEQVILNLVHNAAEAAGNEPAPRIRLSAVLDEDGRCTIRVEDNGPGVPAEIQDRIFVPFFTTKRNGSGIGLSLSRLILARHGATITLGSKPDRGAVFVIRL